MRISLIFIGLFLITFCSNGQPIEVGSKWHYGVKIEQFPFAEGYFSLECIGDTIIGSDTFQLIKTDGKYSLYATYYVRRDSGRTWIWFENNQWLLFDEHVRKGDSLEINTLRFDWNNQRKLIREVSKVHIDSIFKENHNVLSSDSLLVFFFSSEISGFYFEGAYTQKLINTRNEMIGPELLNLFSMPSWDGSYLRCFESPSYQFKSIYTPPNRSCDFHNLPVANIEPQASFTVFPNPADELIQIQLTRQHLRSGTLVIRNMMGETVHQQTLNHTEYNTVEVSKLPEGIYMLAIEYDDAVQVQRLIIR